MVDGESDDDRVIVTVVDSGERTAVETTRGRTLRDLLLEAGVSPYTRVTERANCGGRGLCATCGVRFPEGGPPPDHWHDRLAARSGYPRLSCQVAVEDDLVVELPDKLVWGGRE
ncbi:MAG: 2Fe-2S iron-sulfur cluster-binding protein [Haloferacaceae archaeon]